jgi:Predicted permeases
MEWKDEWKPLAIIVVAFLGCFFLPVGNPRFNHAVMESLYLVKWYAQEHVILCLVPAFFIAGAISVFVSQASVLRYLGVKANKALAYGVASVSGTVLTVCSCTVLPLFAGIYQRGAGLGPATAFLYSGPAINVLAIILSARILGLEMGIARGVGAVLFSVVIGLIMHAIFRKEETEKANNMNIPELPVSRPLWQNVLYFAVMVAILVFANWGRPLDSTGLWAAIYSVKWTITAIFAIALGIMLSLWFNLKIKKVVFVALPVVMVAFLFPHEPMVPFVVGVVGLSIIISTDQGETGEWFAASWGFAKQILPLLLAGVLVAGLLLGRPGVEGLIPSAWISNLVGGNSFWANLFASIVGAFMYFATLTEVPIVQGLIGSGMGKGPALALLLAGPALSLPNMLVLRSIMGTKKTLIYVSLVCVMATITGMIYGKFFE